MEEMIQLTALKKSFGDVSIIHDLNMTVHAGEFLTLLGPSGCGKTTTLRMIAGFDAPTSGDIYLAGASVKDLPPNKRKINTVFQNYALFPNMTVAQNVGFGLKMAKVAVDQREERVTGALDLVQLTGYENRKLDQLSGGQKQRVAIARALVNHPKVLLLDEPLSALDLKLRKQMQYELKRLQRKSGITFVYVTHDQEEALMMSDRIAVMNKGHLEQIDDPKTLYEHPKSSFVATFIGESNVFDGRVTRPNAPEGQVTVETGVLSITPDKTLRQDQIVNVVIRPEKVKVSLTPQPGFHITARISEYYYAGNVNKAVLTLPNGGELKMSSTAQASLPPLGSQAFVYWDLADAIVIKNPADKIYNVVAQPDFSSVNQK